MRGVRIGPAVFTSLFDLPRLKSVFPFLQETGSHHQRRHPHHQRAVRRRMLAATPFHRCGAAGAAPDPPKSAPPPRCGRVVWLAVAGMVITVVDCEMAGVLYRYLMDYSPVLLLGAVLCWLLLESVLARRAAAGETLAVTRCRCCAWPCRRCGVERRLSLLHPFCHPAVAAGTEPLAVL